VLPDLVALLVATLPTSGDVYSETRPMMSTVVTITIAGRHPDEARAAAGAAFAIFSRVDGAMNEWRPESPISALNSAAGQGGWTSLPADVCDVLTRARRGAAATGGLFDPTWAGLRELWRFGVWGLGVGRSVPGQ